LLNHSKVSFNTVVIIFQAILMVGSLPTPWFGSPINCW
jgi:hypothetical protein